MFDSGAPRPIDRGFPKAVTLVYINAYRSVPPMLSLIGIAIQLSLLGVFVLEG